MKNYYRVMLGRKSIHAKACFDGGFTGTHFDIHEDLTGKLTETWRPFNSKYVPVYLQIHPDKSKVAAGLACGAIWTVSKMLRPGDVILSPDGTGRYRVGEIEGEYWYADGEILPHRRTVRWHDVYIDRAAMSEALRNSTGSIGTVSNINGHAEEIEALIGGLPAPAAAPIMTSEGLVEDPVAFGMEKHLEDFLVSNWSQTELGRDYDIYTDDGEIVGQQYPTDTGALDILAISKDRKRLLVVELKKGRASDAVVGQILRYMGFVQDELAEEGQTVEGAVIALDDDHRIRRALAMVPSVSFFRYKVSFQLLRA
jgi:restriction system protein